MTVEIPERIKSVLDRAKYAGPAGEPLILAAEQNLGVAFPSQYRAFLKRYGAAMGTGFMIYGLTDAKEGARPVWVDLRSVAHYTLPEGIPRKVVPISNNGGDYTFYLRTEAKGKVGADAAIVYGPGLDGVQVAADFFDFIEKAASQGVESFIEPHYAR